MSLRLTRVSTMLILAAAGALTTLTGCSDSDASAADVPVVEITLGRFTIEPANVDITAGDVTFRVTNTDTLPHNLTVAGRGTRDLAAGETQTLDVTFSAGQWKMWCDVVGHAAMGQVGVVTATDAPARASTVEPAP